MGCPGQNAGVGCHALLRGLLDSGTKPTAPVPPALAGGPFTAEPPRKPTQEWSGGWGLCRDLGHFSREDPKWSLGTATTSVLHRHGWGGKVGAEPTAAAGWAANPGLCGPWKDLSRRAGTGWARAGHGAPRLAGVQTRLCHHPEIPQYRVGPETPQVFPAAGRVGPLQATHKPCPQPPASGEWALVVGCARQGGQRGRTVLPAVGCARRGGQRGCTVLPVWQPGRRTSSRHRPLPG